MIGRPRARLRSTRSRPTQRQRSFHRPRERRSGQRISSRAKVRCVRSLQRWAPHPKRSGRRRSDTGIRSNSRMVACADQQLASGPDRRHRPTNDPEGADRQQSLEQSHASPGEQDATFSHRGSANRHRPRQLPSGRANSLASSSATNHREDIALSINLSRWSSSQFLRSLRKEVRICACQARALKGIPGHSSVTRYTHTTEVSGSNPVPPNGLRQLPSKIASSGFVGMPTRSPKSQSPAIMTPATICLSFAFLWR